MAIKTLKKNRKYNMIGSGLFSKKTYTTVKFKPKNKQRIKTGTKWTLGIGLVPVPFLAYQAIKHSYRGLTQKTQNSKNIKKTQIAIARYDAKMTKKRGSKNLSYEDQLRITKSVINNSTSSEGKKKKARMIQAYIRAKLSNTDYRAKKFIKRYIQKKGLDTELAYSIQNYQKKKDKHLFTNSNYIPATEKIRAFMKKHNPHVS